MTDRVPFGGPVDYLPIAVRAYVPLVENRALRRWRKRNASEWVLVFDTETTTAPSQRLRFGSFQWRRAQVLERRGLFYDPNTLSKNDLRVLTRYAREHALELLTVKDFVENVFFKLAYELRATIVGFNLPFDISRLAIGHNSARRQPMRGGFTFQLSENRWLPRVQVKHLSRRAAMIRFTGPRRQQTPRGMRKRSRVPVRRGFFVDVKTIGAALTSRSDTLGSLAEFFKVPSRKMVTEEHGGPLTAAYVEYAVNDSQTTWECFDELSRRYAQHELTQTPIHRISSEAGIGKAYYTEMGIEPWRLTQPDFPPELLNIIMQTYYGGRSEVHLRRVLAQIAYLDFLSMYATCCTLMGLWRWIIAKGVDWRDSTQETQRRLDSIVLANLQKPVAWHDLTTLVQVLPTDDLLPVRAPYDGDAQCTIGLNYLTDERPRWYTLADCINATILTGKRLRIVRAVTFVPRDIQQGLRPVMIAGNPQYRVDPRTEDFFKRLIELRAQIKAEMKTSPPTRHEQLDSAQRFIKLLASSTSYGIFVEMNVEELSKPNAALLYSDDGSSTTTKLEQFEQPGRYFHALLATFITGAARLMLGIAERLAIDHGLDWAFCDTDSMAFAKPAKMRNDEFNTRVAAIRAWFQVLNPYDGAGELLKLEDVNYRTRHGKLTDELQPLFVWAISSKRYVLFNLDEQGRPIIRKASAHGLGHLVASYRDKDAPVSIPAPAMPLKDIGVERWQYDVWYRIIEAALNGHPNQPHLFDLPGFDKPAASRYGATTPALLRWFDPYNDGRDYAGQVRPFGFLTAFQATQSLPSDWGAIKQTGVSAKRTSKQSDLPRPIAPFNAVPSRAAEQCFDRITGDAIPADRLKTYTEALAQYHLHPEAKFLNGDYLDSGPTNRRHVHVAGVRYIGKEANRWEEQFYLGFDPETQIEYGMEEENTATIHARVCEAARVYGQRRLAEAAGVSRERLRLFICGKAKLRARTIMKLLEAISVRKPKR